MIADGNEEPHDHGEEHIELLVVPPRDVAENINGVNHTMDAFDDNKNPFRPYVNFVRGLLCEYSRKIVLVTRDAIKSDDWKRLQYLENGCDALQLAIKSCKTMITWPEDQLFPESNINEGDIDELCRSVKQFWTGIELALPRSFEPKDVCHDSQTSSSNRNEHNCN